MSSLNSYLWNTSYVLNTWDAQLDKVLLFTWRDSDGLCTEDRDI